MRRPPQPPGPGKYLGTGPIGTRETFQRLLHAVRYTRPGVPAMKRRSMFMYFVGCLLRFETLRDWFGNPQNPALQEALVQRPSLIGCVRRPYVNNRWSVGDKMEAIRGHYRLLSRDLGFLRFDDRTSMTLARVDSELELRLDKAPWFEHEGELTLSLFAGPRRLYSVAFLLGHADGRRIAYVGALQGEGGDDALDVYRSLTRRLHGLRPRDLIISAFRQFCASLGVHRILAVADEASVSRSPYFRSSVRVFARYDQAWSEHGGRAVDGGFFELSSGLAPRAIEDVPSRKRALYRRRYELLGDIGEQMDAAIRRSAARGSIAGLADGTASQTVTSFVGAEGSLRATRAMSRLHEVQ